MSIRERSVLTRLKKSIGGRVGGDGRGRRARVVVGEGVGVEASAVVRSRTGKKERDRSA